MWSRAFALDLLERVISSFAAALLGAQVAVGWTSGLAVAGTTAGITALKCLTAVKLGSGSSGSLLTNTALAATVEPVPAATGEGV
jgi:cyanophycinase-like exopeptidase